jgi:hypothetical protein
MVEDGIALMNLQKMEMGNGVTMDERETPK